MDLVDENSWTNHTFYEPYPTIRSLLPRHYVGTLIGYRGSTQRQIEKDCGTKISFSTHFTGPNAPPNRVLAIYGPPSDLGRTCAYIMRILVSNVIVKADYPVAFDLLIPEGIAEMLLNDLDGYKMVPILEKLKFKSQLEMLLDDMVLPESTDVRLRIFFNPTSSSDLSRLSNIIIDLAEYMSDHQMETFSPNNVYYNLNGKSIIEESNKHNSLSQKASHSVTNNSDTFTSRDDASFYQQTVGFRPPLDDCLARFEDLCSTDRRHKEALVHHQQGDSGLFDLEHNQFRLLLRSDHISIITSKPAYRGIIDEIAKKYKATIVVEHDIILNSENGPLSVLIISELAISDTPLICQDYAACFAAWFDLCPASLRILLSEPTYHSLIDSGKFANSSCESVWGQIQRATGVCFNEVSCPEGNSGDRIIGLMGTPNTIMQGIKILIEKGSGEP